MKYKPVRCKCGKFMRHSTFSVYSTYFEDGWTCQCGRVRSKKTRLAPIFSKDAFGYIEEN